MQISEKWRRPLLIVAVVIILGFAVSAMVPRLSDMVSLYIKKQELQQESERLRAEKARLEQEKQAMDKPETVERIAREQLGMIKQGEKVIIDVEAP